MATHHIVLPQPQHYPHFHFPYPQTTTSPLNVNLETDDLDLRTTLKASSLTTPLPGTQPSVAIHYNLTTQTTTAVHATFLGDWTLKLEESDTVHTFAHNVNPHVLSMPGAMNSRSLTMTVSPPYNLHQTFPHFSALYLQLEIHSSHDGPTVFDFVVDPAGSTGGRQMGAGVARYQAIQQQQAMQHQRQAMMVHAMQRRQQQSMTHMAVPMATSPHDMTDTRESSINLSDDQLRIVVRLTSQAIPAKPNSNSTTSANAAPLGIGDKQAHHHFSRVLDGREIIDTKFFLFSCRSGDTGAKNPLPVYASATLLRARCEYFEHALGGAGFIESALVSLNQQASETWTDDYAYESDSDLDDDDCDESDDDSEDMDVVLAPSPTGTGKVIVVKDAAYLTWRAMLFYLYTAEIVFAPFGQDKDPAHVRAVLIPPQASAKSIYRLADKLGLDDLRLRALAHIRRGLSEDTVFTELFGTFTARYAEVQEAEMQFALEHWETLKSSPTLSAMLEEVAAGRQPHCANILRALLFR